MNVLFLYTNINGFHTDCYAFGLASIVSVTRSNGYSAKVIVVKNRECYLKILETIEVFNPRVVGFTSVSSQFIFVKEIAALIKKKFPEIIIVCGGIHPTINPNCVLDTEHLDTLFIGESENSFIELLDKIRQGKCYKDVDNLAYAQNGTVKINKLKPLITDLDSLPYPDKEVYPYEDTLRETGYAPFFFSRGCPYLCSYCSNHMIAKRYGLERNSPRYRSVESSILEIEKTIRKFNVRTVWILDDIFGLDKKWRSAFCAEYKKRIKKKFICLLRVNVIDGEFMRMLKDAGCLRIFIGLESGNEFIRADVMNRHMTNEQILNAFDIAHKSGLQTNAINMIGLPGETEEMVWDTIKLNRRIKPTMSCVSIFYPYKGTNLGNYCFEKGLVNESMYSSFSNERRESVLNFPQDYKWKLIYFRENWERFVYPRDFKKKLLWFMRKTFIWEHLRKIKRSILILGSHKGAGGIFTGLTKAKEDK